MSDEIVLRPATGGLYMSDDAIDRCSDPRELYAALAQHWLPSLARWLDDPEWPIADEGGRRIAQEHIARMGRVLARLTELVDEPPLDLVEGAKNRRALREADAVITELRGRLVPFPKAAAS